MVEVVVVDQNVCPLSGVALAEIFALPLDVSTHARVFGIGGCPVTQRHALGGLVERDVKEDGEVPVHT